MQASQVHAGDVAIEVVEKVAEAEGVDPLDLTSPLYDAIDPDALNKLFVTMTTADRMDGHVTFPYTGYDVTV